MPFGVHHPLIHIYTHTKFQWNPPKHFQDMAENVMSRVFIRFHYSNLRKKCPCTLAAVFSNGQEQFSNLAVVSKFHENWAKMWLLEENKTAPPPPQVAMFSIRPFTNLSKVSCSVQTNVLTKFHKDLTKNVTFKRLQIDKMPCPQAAMFFIRPNNFCSPLIKCSSKFHEHWTLHVTSQVFKGFHYIHLKSVEMSLRRTFWPSFWRLGNKWWI